ncbi:hypothetical protein [Flavobacterium dankookense]|uniref:Uncharacterized protein n=1 Tax=Flavobacterium dankookense TaxID=706186 RepID=A0A4R6QE85_9FLAO|nr:hypothetical protein [Flavobacterium dankookense]TDP60705.1 hypothetical protein BC748_0302 [Flavobacterium dankookense]
MNIIEWINNTFGIDNTVSVPTLISIVVFITGGIMTYLFTWIKDFNNRKNLRKTFYLLLEEVIQDLKIKEKHASEFYPQITVSHNGSWFLPHKPISYLETIFELDFKDNYYAFRKKFFWNFCSRKIRNRAYHKIWTILRTLKFFEERIDIDIENLVNKFDFFHKQYNTHLEEYRKYHDDLNRKYNGFRFPPTQRKLYEFLMAEDRIWKNWQDLGEENRTRFFVTYNQLIKLVLDLNKQNSDLEITQESDNLLLSCSFQFIEMENILNIYQLKFKQYHDNYKKSHRLLKKCLELIE